jgi:hypothetical protein
MTLSGVTAGAVPAGTHAFSYGGECSGAGTVSTMVVELAGQLSVIVLP